MDLAKKISEKIRKDGWKGIAPAIIYWLKLLSANAYRQLILRNKLIVRLLPMRKPTILLMSYPRSGSSWIGDILALSKDVAYLLEPVTSPYQEYYGGVALANLDDEKVYKIYCQYSWEAFLGMPLKKKLVRENLSDFSLVNRQKRRLLIKEVNPRATGFYCQHYDPLILLLLRHPAAVALSFWEMGWLTAPDVQMEAAYFSGDSWEKFGYAYGLTMKNSIESIKKFAVPYKILLYEHFAENPSSEFTKVFSYLDVNLPNNYESIIDEFCFSGTTTQGYETRRVSKLMIAKWKEKLPVDSINKIRRGYTLSGFEYYQSDADWAIAESGASN